MKQRIILGMMLAAALVMVGCSDLGALADKAEDGVRAVREAARDGARAVQEGVQVAQDGVQAARDGAQDSAPAAEVPAALITATAIDVDGQAGADWIEVVLGAAAPRDLNGNEFVLWYVDPEGHLGNKPCKTSAGDPNPAQHVRGLSGCDDPFIFFPEADVDTWAVGDSLYFLCAGPVAHKVLFEYKRDAGFNQEKTVVVDVTCDTSLGERRQAAGRAGAIRDGEWLTAMQAAELAEKELGGEAYFVGSHVSVAAGDHAPGGHQQDASTPAPAGGLALSWEVSVDIDGINWFCAVDVVNRACTKQDWPRPDKATAVRQHGVDSTDAYAHWVQDPDFARFVDEPSNSILITVEGTQWSAVITAHQMGGGGSWTWDPARGVDVGNSY